MEKKMKSPQLNPSKTLLNHLENYESILVEFGLDFEKGKRVDDELIRWIEKKKLNLHPQLLDAQLASCACTSFLLISFFYSVVPS